MSNPRYYIRLGLHEALDLMTALSFTIQSTKDMDDKKGRKLFNQITRLRREIGKQMQARDAHLAEKKALEVAGE